MSHHETAAGIATIWALMRDTLRAAGHVLNDGDGSTAAIAECAQGAAGVLFTTATMRPEPDRALLTAAGAPGMLATAARLHVATRGGEATAAARAAVLAGDLFEVCRGDLRR